MVVLLLLLSINERYLPELVPTFLIIDIYVDTAAPSTIVIIFVVNDIL